MTELGLGPWTTHDYDRMSWHDAHVYGFHFESFDDAEGSADLILDIDFILEWPCKLEEGALFKLCQALLRFEKVFRLHFKLDYATPTAGMCPFSIKEIEREEISFPNGYKSYRWLVPFNWPHGHIEFEAPGFTQTMVGSPQLHDAQLLPLNKRRGVYAA